MGGFAVGQLFWGPLSDRIGRRLPILASLALFSAVSFVCAAAGDIETFWIARFFQAFFGCAPVVISHAVITDAFPSGKILLAFAILSMAQSVAPIAGPAAGNMIRELLSWRHIFCATGIAGILSAICTFLFLKETRSGSAERGGFFAGCAEALRNRAFVSGSVTGSAVYVALMAYISNSAAIIGGAFFISGKSGQNKSEAYLKISFAGMAALSAALVGVSLFAKNPWATAAILFCEMFALGALFPITTNLALKPFSGSDNSGTASSLFGFFQLASAFLFTAAANRLFDDPLALVSASLLACSIIGIAPYAARRKGAEIRP